MKDKGVYQSGWDTERQKRFDMLSADELAGKLNEAERREYVQLTVELEAEERQRLTPTLEQMRREQAALRRKVRLAQDSNERLAILVAQQEQMLTDARQTLNDLQRRHQIIRETFYRVTGEVLAPAA